MNERIKELAEQLGFDDVTDYKWECTHEQLERFAELVRQDEREKHKKINMALVELANALNDALIDVCSTNPNGEISRKHYQRIQDANAKIKEQA